MKRLLMLLLPTICLGIYDMKWFELNHWRCPIDNLGRWGMDYTQSPVVGAGTWPNPLHNVYVFGAGPWVGTIVGSDTLVTLGYNPNTGGTEMHPSLCRYWRQTPLDSADRVYKFPIDWPPPISRFPMAPQENRSETDLWSCFGDSNPENHSPIPPGRPLGIDIYLTVYGFSDSIARDIFFLKYELANASVIPLNGVYFGMVVDADIGNPIDDMTGLILNKRFRVGTDTFWVRNLGFFYDYDNIEPPGRDWEDGVPGAVALRLLQAPNNLGLTAFKRFTIEIDPVRDPEQYLTLKGYNYRTGQYEPYDSIDPTPADKRALFATGPFDLAPDSVATLWYAVIGAPYGDSGQTPQARDTTELALRSWWSEQVWQWILGIEDKHRVQPTVRPILYPNPYRLGKPLHIATNEPVRIYDTQGRLVKELTADRGKIWNGTDRDGSQIPAGIYFVRTGYTQSKGQKVLIIQE
ncbi:MAG: T9SS type A sorting domain-containing protein [bacterium]